MTKKEEFLSLLKTLSVIPAPSGQEEKRADFCLAYLLNHGCEGSFMDQAGNVIYPWHDRGDNELLVLMAHMDVVFPDTGALPLYEDEEKIYCPGVMDNTANLVNLLKLAEYTACLSEANPSRTASDQRLDGSNARMSPASDTDMTGILFVCSTGEEGLGNLKGCREICRKYGDRIQAFLALDLTMDSYTARAVGSLRYELRLRARGGHSYLDFGNSNAIEKAARLIEELYQIPLPAKGKSSYNVGKIEGGTSVNTIAQSCSFLYEIRSDDAQAMEELRKAFEAAAIKRGAEVKLLGERPCEKDADKEFRRKLFEMTENAIEKAIGKRPQAILCSTDCNIPLSMGIPSVCVGSCLGSGAHTRQEYMIKDSLLPGYEAVKEKIMGILEKSL